MTNTVNQTGAIAQARKQQVSTKKNEPTNLQGWLKRYEKQIAKALPAQIGSDRFNRICMTALAREPKLAECTPASFIGAILCTAQLGLEPNTPLGQAYLIPYRNHGVPEVQYQIGYKGMIELARRSGDIAMIKAQAVHANDEFSYELGLNPTIHHVPAKGPRGDVIAYYAFYKTKDGDFDFEVAYKQEILDFALSVSPAFKSGKSTPWKTHFDEMAKKTLIKRVLKYAPMATEVAAQIQTDTTIKRVDLESDAVSDMTLIPDSTVYEAEYEESEVDAKTDQVTGEVKENA